jgi:steroid delta-isomerase-like uncharacterized protein
MQLVERLYELWNAHNSLGLQELYTDDCEEMDLTNRREFRGKQAVAEQFERYVRAFPDVTVVPQKSLIQGDSATIYWTASGTHQGTLLNIPPTGRMVEIHGMSLLTCQDGKIKQAIHLWDMAGLLRAIGLLPELTPLGP